jgi:hypothetical protein
MGGMSATPKAAHTPGAMRAGQNISDRFRKALPHLPEGNAETLAAIIDAETAAPEMLEALNEAQKELLGASCYLATCDPVTIVQNLDSLVASLKARLAIVEAAIQKARGGQ